MELVMSPMSKSRFGIELRASYYGPARIRLLVTVLVVLMGLTAMVVAATALRIYF